MTASEDQLMKRIGQGDERAFQELFDLHGGKVLGYATRLLGDSSRAEDLAQEVWMKVIQQAPHYDGKGQFIAWVYTMTRNRVFNEMRQQKKWADSVSVEDESVLQMADPKDLVSELVEHAEKNQVMSAIDHLPDMQRLALMSWLTEDLSYDELSQKMDVSVSALKSLLFRARKAVLEKVKES